MRANRVVVVAVVLAAAVAEGKEPRPATSHHLATPSDYSRASSRRIDAIVIHKAEGGASNHTDPGAHFDWPKLMRLINGSDAPGVAPVPPGPSSGGSSRGGASRGEAARAGVAGGVEEVRREIEGRAPPDRAPASATGKGQEVREVDWGDTLWDIARAHGSPSSSSSR